MVAMRENIVALAPPQPAFDDSLLARARTREAVELYMILRNDFAAAMQLLVDQNAAQSARRHVVRSFGSLIEGLADAMRTVAVTCCEFHGKSYNRFLNAKSVDRGLATQNRIESTYRIVHEALPKSPLARVPDQRWNDLHKALEIRNRIVHPRAAADLELTDEEMKLICSIGFDFTHDFSVFAQWHGQKQQKLGWAAGGQRRRQIPKVGRNEKCPCRSGRKYKNCCAEAQYAT